MSEKDKFFMKQALFLAQLKKGTTSPKPTVGAILVDRYDNIIAQGVTQPTGEHAEQMILNNLDTKVTQESTLYVTLEPCSIEINTPSCAKLIIEKKIRRVVVAVLDYNPQIKGDGIKLLKDHGVDVSLGLLEQKAFDLNEDFFIATTKKRPMVFAKYATSLDGYLALDHGGGQGLSNKKSQRLNHLFRYRSDAILVGAQTILSDNPTLTARALFREKKLLKVILDPKGEVPLKSHVLSDVGETLMVFNSQEVSKDHINAVYSLPNKSIFFQDHFPSLKELLSYLYLERKIISLMVEGGGEVLSSFLTQRLVDKVFHFVTPFILGSGIKPFSRLGINKIDDVPILNNIKSKQLDNNVLIYGNVQCPRSPIKQ